jgi:hypothetical protein
MAKDQEEFNKSWESVSKILNENESVPTGYASITSEVLQFLSGLPSEQIKNLLF